MSSSEFAEWQIRCAREPFGEERADLRAALIAATFANAHRPKGRRPFKLEDFLLRFQDPTAEPAAQTPDEMLRFVEELNRALGGKDLRKKTKKGRRHGG